MSNDPTEFDTFKNQVKIDVMWFNSVLRKTPLKLSSKSDKGRPAWHVFSEDN